MEESGILLTLTQVTVAFVGFAGIIATFQFADGFRIKKKDAVALGMIINTGLVGAFFSVLPLAFSSFGLKDSIVWALCSGIMSLNYMGFMYYLASDIKKFKVHTRSAKVILATYFLVGFIVMVLNLLNAFNIVFHREFGPFLISLIYPLCIVGFMFSRLLLRPIWRTIRDQESGI